MSNINRESFNHFVKTNMYSNGKIDDNKLKDLNLKECIIDNIKYTIFTYPMEHPLNKDLKNKDRAFCSFKESK